MPSPGRVLITGARSGLGRAASLLFAEQGHRVYATMRDPRQGKEPAGRHGRGVIHVLPLDVRDRNSVDAALAATAELGGEPDTVVLNAGVELQGPVESLDPADLRWQLETNLFGALTVVQAVLPGMRRRGSGRLVFVSSIVGRVARPLLGGYCASKFALEGLAEALRLETRHLGIHVSLLEPGRFPSELGGRARRADWEGEGADPYASVRAGLAGSLDRLEPSGYAPEVSMVAQALLELAADPEPPLRKLVGDDALYTDRLVSRDGFGEYAALFG